MYNKLFTKILDSSIWLEPTPTRIVWLTLLAVMDERGFAQFATVGNVAHRARVTLAEAEAAIATLEGPDPGSSDPDFDGRRIERVPGGWIVLNSEKHRKLVTKAIIQEQTRERVRRHREKKRNGNGQVTPSEAIALAEVQEESTAAPPQTLSSENSDMRQPNDNYRVILKLVHGIMDKAEDPNDYVTVKEDTKSACARRKILYDSTVLGRALDSAFESRKARASA